MSNAKLSNQTAAHFKEDIGSERLEHIHMKSPHPG